MSIRQERIQEQLVKGTYQPVRNRIKEIPKANGKTRKLGIATIGDRVVQGAVKLILEPVFESDFQEGSYGYRPKRTAHQAIERVAEAVVKEKESTLSTPVAPQTAGAPTPGEGEPPVAPPVKPQSAEEKTMKELE